MISGDEKLAKAIEGKTVAEVSNEGGWIEIICTDGTRLHISAEFGYSLVCDLHDRSET